MGMQTRRSSTPAGGKGASNASREKHSDCARSTITNKKQKASHIQLAQERLHVAMVPSILPCRDDQFCELYANITSALQEKCGSCIYVSGVPG
jgi:hypothetical protein